MKQSSTFSIACITLILSLFYSCCCAQDLNVASGIKVTVNSGSTVKIHNGDLVLHDDQNTAPSLLDLGTIEISPEGKTLVEQFIVKDRWHIVSTPVYGALAASYEWMFLNEYQESTGELIPIVSLATPLNLSTGYFVWAYTVPPEGNPVPPDYITQEGALNKSDIIVNLSYTPGTSNPGWNLIGNPFPCALNWNDHPDWNRNNVDASIYVYDITTGGGGTNGNYRVYNYLTGIGIPEGNDGVVAATQGFNIKANSEGASLTLPASQRLHSSKPFYKKSDSSFEKLLRIKAWGKDSPYFCETVLAFHDEGDPGYDGNLDALYLKGNEQAPGLYTMLDELRYSINILSNPEERQTVPLYFEAPNKDTYTITFSNESSFPDKQEIYLEDRFLNQFQNLKDNPVYTFEANEAMNVYRFNIHFNDLNQDPKTQSGGVVNIYAANQKIYVILPDDKQNNSSPEADIFIFNLMGQQVIHIETHEAFNAINMTGQEKNHYVVKVLYNNELSTDKVFVY